MNNIHYFTQAQSAKGYVNYFYTNFSGLKKITQMCGFPQDIILQLCKSETRDAHIIHDCLNGGATGIILPRTGEGIISTPLLSKAAVEHIEEARRRLYRAFEIRDEWEQIYVENTDFDVLDDLAFRWSKKLVGERFEERPAARFDRFSGALTAFGAKAYGENITRDITRRYFLRGRPGTGKSTFLKKIAAAALRAGADVELYHSCFDPDSVDMIAVRAFDFCVFGSTAPHEYPPDRESDSVIDLYALAVKKNTDEKYAGEIETLKKRYDEKIAAAEEAFALANDERIKTEKLIRSQTGDESYAASFWETVENFESLS